MLDTVVEYCPALYIPSDTVFTHVVLAASYDGLSCPTAMDCHVRYTLDWEAPSPAPAGGECVAPPTPSPTEAPAAPPSPAPVGDSEDSHSNDVTPAPTPDGSGDGGGEGGNGGTAGNGGDVTASSSNGGGGGGGSSSTSSNVPVVNNYLSRSVVKCSEAWANCTTLETSTRYEERWAGQGCTKLESMVGQVGVGLYFRVTSDMIYDTINYSVLIV